MDVKRYKPRCVVHFFTESGNLIARATEDFNNKSGNLIDEDVISVQTSRDMGADAPTFSISLTRRRKWHKLIASNDLIGIQMVRPPEKNRTVFVGLVDDVRKSITMGSDGKPQRSIIVSGRGMAKALIQFDIGQVPESETVSVKIGWLANNGINFAGVNADVIIQSVWDNLVKRFVNYKFADGRNLFDIAKTQLSARTGAKLSNDMGLINWQGSLWAFVKQVTDEPFNEIFWETDGQYPILKVRPTPFNKTEWNNLESYTLTDDEVVAEDIGRSDVETFTLFSVGMSAYFSSQDVFKTHGIQPIWYEPYKEKYGIRRLHVESVYTSWAGREGQTALEDMDVVKQLSAYSQDLYNWNIKNNQFYNGTLVVRGSNRFKVGTRLSYFSEEEGETLEFYIRSVSHQFVNFGSWITILMVTRGSIPEDRFTSPVGAYTNYSGVGWSFYDPASVQRSTSFIGINTSSPIFIGKVSSVVRGAQLLMSFGDIKYADGGGAGIPEKSGDCSQFTEYVFKTYADIEIGRSTVDQISKGVPIAEIGDLVPGDLVFFKNTVSFTDHILGVSHVGIFTGGTTFINLGSDGVKEGDLTSTYWKPKWLRGGRIITDSIQSSLSGTILLDVKLTAYGGSIGNGGAGTWETYTGTKPIEGKTIAVDPTVIPLHSQVLIECPSYPGIHNKIFTAEDIGSDIKGKWIDIYFEDQTVDEQVAKKSMNEFGVRYAKVTIL